MEVLGASGGKMFWEERKKQRAVGGMRRQPVRFRGKKESREDCRRYRMRETVAVEE